MARSQALRDDTEVGLVDPVPESLAHLLREAVLLHVTSERRRAFPPTVHLGSPGRGVTSVTSEDVALDHALRTDLLEAMLSRARRRGDVDEPLAWVTRSGTLEVQDADLAWRSAACSASRELGIDLPLVVVTRQGWRDPWTGTSRTWRRLRPRRA